LERQDSDVDDEVDLKMYFHFNNPSKSVLVDFVSKQPFPLNDPVAVEYLDKLEDGVPVEHSDKWGKATQPYAVSLKSRLVMAANTEFWSKGVLQLDSTKFSDPLWTHYTISN